MTINQELSLLVREHLHDDVQQLALQRNRYPQLSDADFRFLWVPTNKRQAAIYSEDRELVVSCTPLLRTMLK